MTTTYRAIGNYTSRIESAGKATGGAKYTADVDLPGMLWAKVLRSPVAHAIIKRIDTSKAKALPGVHAVVTHEDTPGVPLSEDESSPESCQHRVKTADHTSSSGTLCQSRERAL